MKGSIIMLKQIGLKRLGIVGATAIAGLFALNSCISRPSSRKVLSDGNPAVRIDIDTITNDSLISLYGDVVKEDSIDMINAQKAMKNINMRKLEKDYASASTAREKARMQLAIAEKDGKADIIADCNKKLNEVMARTQDAVDAYNNALHTSRVAKGEFYSKSKDNYSQLKEFASSSDYLDHEIKFSSDLQHAYAVSPSSQDPIY